MLKAEPQDTRPAYLVELMDRVGIIPRSLEGLGREAITALARGMGADPDDVERAAKRWGLW